MRQFIYLIAALAAACAGLTSVVWLTGRSLPRSPEIAFVSEHDGDADIYLLDLNRSITSNMTKDPTSDEENPVWSPDGSRLIYEIFRDGNRALGVMNADGSGHYRLAAVSLWDERPVWSPDGSLIAFNALDGLVGRVIYTIASACLPPADARCPVVYHNLTGKAINNFDYQWSPDSQHLVYVSNQGRAEIYAMDADGSHLTQLTHNDANDFSPVWSPDGKRIVFQSDRSGNIDLYWMKPDGSDTHPLTADAAYDDQAVWSPNGRYFAFTSDADGDRDIYLADTDSIDAHGAALRKLTDNNDIDDLAVWSPDGTSIAYISNQDAGDVEIYVMNADASQQRRVTHHVGVDWAAAWRP